MDAFPLYKALCRKVYLHCIYFKCMFWYSLKFIFLNAKSLYQYNSVRELLIIKKQKIPFASHE